MPSEIVQTENVLHGKPRVEGTRVSVKQIYDMHVFKELSAPRIAERLPVTAEEARAAIEWKEKRIERGEETESLTVETSQ